MTQVDLEWQFSGHCLLGLKMGFGVDEGDVA